MEVGYGPTRTGQYQRATGGRLPDWYQKEPLEIQGDHLYLRAFNLLATDRQYLAGQEGGIGPIPWSKAVLFASELGFSRRARMWFADVLMVLDQKWRENERLEQDKEEKRKARQQRRDAATAKGKRTLKG